MADLRTTALIDDFARADETPIQPPWIALTGFGIVEPRLKQGEFWPNNSTSNKTSAAYWSQRAFAGDTIEVWGEISGSVDLSEGVRLGWLNDIGASTFDGYLWMLNNSVGDNEWQIQKLTNGSASTILSQSPMSDIGTGDCFIFRREDDDLVGYKSQGGYASFSEESRVTDTTFITGDFYVTLVIDHDDANDPTWNGVGGGALGSWMPEFIRRPWEYHGGHLSP